MKGRNLVGYLATVALCVAMTLAVAAEQAVGTIALRFRTAAEVLPLLAPHLDRSGTLSGARNEIVIRSTPSNLAELRRIAADLDRPPRRLLVTMRQDAPSDGRAYGTRNADGDASVQRVQVLEGREANIRIGQSVPVTLRGSARRVIAGQTVPERLDVVEYRDILSGFAVTPRLSGDTVVLDLSPQDDTPGAQGRGSMDVRRITTTLAGRLGDWIEVGAIGPEVVSSGDAAVISTRSARASARRILVKVEAID